MIYIIKGAKIVHSICSDLYHDFPDTEYLQGLSLILSIIHNCNAKSLIYNEVLKYILWSTLLMAKYNNCALS